MAPLAIRAFATPLISLLLLAASPMLHASGESLQPQFVTLPTTIPVGQSIFALVYLHANRNANGFRTPAVLSGTALAATFDNSCHIAVCPASDAGYWPFYLSLPALSATTYTLNIEGSSDPAPLRFVFTIDGQTPHIPPAQLATVPAQPPAGQPIDAFGYFVVQAYPSAWGFAFDPTTVSGSTITVPMYPIACPFECPPVPNYGAYHVALPALAPGSYTLKFVDKLIPGNVFAQFPLAVGAADPVPMLDVAGTAALLLLAIVVAYARLRRTE